MKIEFSDELIIEGVARAAERLLLSEQLVERVATAIAMRFELIEPEVAADILGVTTATLRTNHVAWGLDKSLAFGATNPRFFLAQLLERSKEKSKVVAGRKPELRKLAA